jgi:hypothetical protein
MSPHGRFSCTGRLTLKEAYIGLNLTSLLHISEQENIAPLDAMLMPLDGNGGLGGSVLSRSGTAPAAACRDTGSGCVVGFNTLASAFNSTKGGGAGCRGGASKH